MSNLAGSTIVDHRTDIGTSEAANEPRPLSLQPELSIIIPAFNEERGIPLVLEKLRESLPEAEIIVVDDASTDDTAAHAAAFDKVHIVRHPFNRGYGASLKSGMKRARGTCLAWFDADNEHRVEDLVAMFDMLRSERLAAVIGERRNPAPSVVRTIGKLAIRTLARSLGSNRIKDINCGLRVFHRDAILRFLPLLPDKFSASMTSTMILMERGYPIAFHPISVNPRIGQSKVAFKDGLAALFSVIRIIMLVAPMRILFTGGIAAALLGGFYGLARMIELGGGFPNSALLMVSVGMFLCVLGLIADQISHLRFHAADTEISTDDGDARRDSDTRPR